MRVLGVDPGYDRLGVAIIEKTKGRERLIFSECLTANKTLAFSARLLKLGQGLEKIIKKYRPDCLALEDLFFAKNRKTALAVAAARGLIIYLAAKYGLAVTEHSPNTVKLTITGYGRADKIQMISMLKKLISLEKPIKYDDEFDAIAVALTRLSTGHLK